ncbi:hypothetical protein LJR034_003034 [Caballeronia sp. LjRoot34]|uniref:hypothetical protein n=1 Tax=Caballeronia sp. LjRoot34 TaxID=3342325 RepID=UPI003ED06136
MLDLATHLRDIIVHSYFLGRNGHGHVSAEDFAALMTIMAALFEKGMSTGQWKLEADGYDRCAAIVSLHDWQLHSVPMSALSAASDQVERYLHSALRGPQDASR